MWQGKGKGKGSDRAKNRIQIQMRRIRGEVRLQDPAGSPEAIQVRAILNDLSGKGVGLFSQKMLQPGTAIELTFEESKVIKIKGNVVWCHEHHLGSHILSQTPFGFRAGIQFTFENADEEATIAKICDDLARLHPVQVTRPGDPPAAATPAASPTGDPATQAAPGPSDPPS